MPADPKAVELISRWEKLKVERYNWDSQFQDVVDLVITEKKDFNRTSYTGERRERRIYDGTAREALEQLAAGLHSYLTNPADRWFNVEVHGYDSAQDPEALAWLEKVTDIIYSEYGREETNLNPTLHEGYLDLGAFGTGVIYQDYDHKLGAASFREYPLADCWIAENHQNRVDTVFRLTKMTTRQCKQEFGDNLPEKIEKCLEKEPDKCWHVLHAVFPRSDRNPYKANAANKAFASCWVSVEEKVVLREGGYDSFPYHVPRWSKMGGEVYGRSPALKALPSIKMANEVQKVIIRASQKMVDPPLMIPSDGFMPSIHVSPGAFLWKEPGTENAEPLLIRGDIPAGIELLDSTQDFIRKCFYFDWIRRPQKKERQTAYEIADDRDEMLMSLSPILGRMQSELLGNMVSRTFELLRAAGRIPPAPPSLAGARLKLSYQSPAARSQFTTKAQGVGRFLQDMAPIAQLNPAVMDGVDFDVLMQSLALWRGLPRASVKSPQDIEEIRAQRAEQEQIAQVAGAAEPVSKALLNVSQAQAQPLVQ